jgi:hypothetical protein
MRQFLIGVSIKLAVYPSHDKPFRRSHEESYLLTNTVKLLANTELTEDPV